MAATDPCVAPAAGQPSGWADECTCDVTTSTYRVTPPAMHGEVQPPSREEALCRFCAGQLRTMGYAVRWVRA